MSTTAAAATRSDVGTRPIVFLGPSIPLAEARRIIDADFRAPCRRGDLATIPGGSLVGLIDGVFHQDDAVSPRELVYALERGVTILGSSSMGALRAVEVPGVIGVGRVYEMYRTGTISSDDEVALLFDPERFVPTTVPLVNVRYAVERLVRSGTIDGPLGSRIVEAAKRLHYRDRAYPRILEEAGLGRRADVADLAALLQSHDLKQDDARLLLERLPDHAGSAAARTSAGGGAVQTRPDYGPPDQFGAVRAAPRMAADAPVLVWEIGGQIRFRELVSFLKLTGTFDRYARRALYRFLAAGGSLAADLPEPALRAGEVKSSLLHLCRTWGWNTREEVHVTLQDLGLGFDDLQELLGEETRARHALASLVSDPPELFLRALRAELLLDDLALKREAMRCRALALLAQVGAAGQPPRDEETARSRQALCRLHDGTSWKSLRPRLEALGLSGDEIDSFVTSLVGARWIAEKLRGVRGGEPERREADGRFGIEVSPKRAGERRFAIPLEEAHAHALRLKERIGVTRVAMVSGLSDLEGVFVSQAARPAGVWSSSYGSGKGVTEQGAIVGAIMEETEKWAQEQFTGEPVLGSYAGLRERENVLDPRRLDLPYDSAYHEDLEIAWQRCFDLIQGKPILVPLAAVACSFNAGRNNIFYSARGARVTFSTNGLASGFTLAEALVHGTCEYIERHAVRMAELRVDNPGVGERSRWPRRIAPESLPGFVRDLYQALSRADCQVAVWDVTSDVGVPTVYARLVKDQELARGWACHPNPAVAVQMALLEAAQTVVAAVAAGREDLTIKARSLGRHERANPLRGRAQAFWQDPDAATIPLAAMDGCALDDARAELDWIRGRLCAAGVENLVAVDLGRPEIQPAHAVRVLVPGLETNNPYYTGPRAQLALVEDLVAVGP